MSKILSIFLLSFFFLFNYGSVFAEEKIRIYSRSEWGANENYGYINSIYWRNILSNRRKNSEIWDNKWINYSQIKKYKITLNNKIKSEKIKKQNKYLSDNFSKYIKLIEYNKFDGNNKLAWPISKTEFIKNIVIHHTQTEYQNSWDGIKKIHKYHSLNREWGDIGYNFIIGNNGEIFEGRAGGDYSVGAHDTLNNKSTVGISIMGNYQNKDINSSQYNSLKKLISYLTKKYGIDLNQKIPYHTKCFGKNCINPINTNYYFPIVGHKDGKKTACPGKYIYKNTIPQLIRELKAETKGYENISYLKRKEEIIKYKDKINNQYNWQNVKKHFNKFTQNSQNNILNKLNRITRHRLFNWKNEILYKKLLNELKS